MKLSGRELNIGVVGAGAMGSGIAQVAARAGDHVVVYDLNKDAVDRSVLALAKGLQKLIEKQKISVEESKNISERIRFTNDIQELGQSDLVIEAVVEDLKIKKTIFTQLEQIVSTDCVLASNTSSLSITSIASACKHPERVAGVHFFNPATLMPLTEIIAGDASNVELIPDLCLLMEKWKKIPVKAKDTPGFIVNRLARPYYGESIRILEEGIADIATIDWAMRDLGGFKMGPFELMDLIGNDVNYTVTETVWKQFFYDPRYKPSLTQRRLFESGNFGKKTGKGYYDYSKPMPEPKKDQVEGAKIMYRVLAMLINEAAEAFYLKIASREDLDLAMVKGVNYPKGLLKWADEIGVKKILSILTHLYEEYGDDRYRSSVQLKKMLRDGKHTFYE